MAGTMKWRARLLLALFALLIFGGILNATETRVRSLGGTGLFIYDDTNIFIFPATLSRYSGAVIGELRVKNVSSSYTIGAHLPLTNTMDAAIYLNRPINLNVPGNFPGNTMVNRVTDVFWGSQLANSDVAARFTIGLDSYTQENGTTTKDRARYLGFAGGISNDLFDAGVLFELPGAKHEVGDASIKWSGFGFGINGRAHLAMNNALTIVPVATFYLRSSKVENQPAVGSSSTTDFGRLNLFLGAGLRYNITEDNQFILGLEAFGIDRTSMKNGTESSETTTTFPGIYMGVESTITSWLVGRLGAREITMKTKNKVDVGGTTTTTIEKSKSFGVFFGASLQKGNFILDASVNGGLLFDSVYFISGIPQSIADQISVVYIF